jgi:hypothetical protein
VHSRFSLKFQQIVQREQEANFISRLHRGRINIVPWPVIESKQFYTLFSSLKKVLDREPVTHPHAGVFLHTLKTLMAKLKVGFYLNWKIMLLIHDRQMIGALCLVSRNQAHSESPLTTEQKTSQLIVHKSWEPYSRQPSHMAWPK